MKYKVGDKVKVRSDLKAYEIYGSNMLTKSMEKFAGKTVTISGVGITSYAIEEMEVAYWTDEMLEPVEEMSAEEAISLQSKICRENNCTTCPIQKIPDCGDCEEYMIEHPEEVVKALKQWKADHEKKDVEVEFACIVRVIEDTGDVKKCVYEEDIPYSEDWEEAQVRVLKEYCKDHNGKFFAVMDSICRVKE